MTFFDMTKERLRAIVNLAIAEAEMRHPDKELQAIHLVVYGSLAEAQAQRYFDEVRFGTPAAKARLVLIRGTQRYICWNCSGLHYESESHMCPNCGEEGYKAPDEVVFGLRKIEMH